VTGSYVNNNAVKVAIDAIREVTGSEPLAMESIQKSAWMIARMKEKEDVLKLAKQIMMIEMSRKLIVVFRPIVMEATTERVVEVKNLRNKQQIKELKERFATEGIEVVKQTPQEENWSTTYTERNLEVEGTVGILCHPNDCQSYKGCDCETDKPAELLCLPLRRSPQ
jgi:hypothetical protein